MVIDEYTRRCLACVVDVSIGARRVQHVLEQLFDEHGSPEVIRTDNGREFIAETLTDWLAAKGVAARPVEKASPQQNALIETFHATMRRELLNWESFDTMLEGRAGHDRPGLVDLRFGKRHWITSIGSYDPGDDYTSQRFRRERVADQWV